MEHQAEAPDTPARLRVSRLARVPDAIRADRCRRAPELGPRIAFFSGGSALRDVSRVLKQYTHNSLHLVTVFDSGGSSARLRDAFQMPSVGDLRNRLLSLADETEGTAPALHRLLGHRFAESGEHHRLRAELDAIITGEHPLIVDVPRAAQALARTQLERFVAWMPVDFDLCGASVGNLLLAGGYLDNGRDIDAVLAVFASLVGALGQVRPIAIDILHLAADLEDGTTLIGQHRITGKAMPAIRSPIARLYTVSTDPDAVPTAASALATHLAPLDDAELICFPMGSFYTSLVATVLPRGVGAAIARAECPKVFVPNTGRDPEMLGMSLSAAVATLLRYLRTDAGDVEVGELLNAVLIDSTSARYAIELDIARARSLGVEVLDTPLVSARSAPHIDPELLTKALVSLS